jgi:hypothetical protein
MTARRKSAPARPSTLPPAAPPPAAPSEPHELPCLGENPVKLATVAAPFVAADMDFQEALCHAWKLISEAERYLGRLERDAVFNDPLLMLDLDRALAQLGIKRPATLRDYLKAIEPVEGPKIWQAAKRGERVFGRELMKRLVAHRDALHAARQQKSADARRAKSVNKISVQQRGLVGR